jgi:hypothetical protein
MRNVDALDRFEFSSKQEFMVTLLAKVSGTAWINYAVSRRHDFLEEIVRILPDRERTQEAHGKQARAELVATRFFLQLNGVPSALQIPGATRIREAAKRDKSILKRLFDYMSMYAAEFLYHCEVVNVNLAGTGTPGTFKSLADEVRANWRDDVYEVQSNQDAQFSMFQHQNQFAYIRLATRCEQVEEVQNRILSFLRGQGERKEGG